MEGQASPWQIKKRHDAKHFAAHDDDDDGDFTYMDLQMYEGRNMSSSVFMKWEYVLTTTTCFITSQFGRHILTKSPYNPSIASWQPAYLIQTIPGLRHCPRSCRIIHQALILIVMYIKRISKPTPIYLWHARSATRHYQYLLICSISSGLPGTWANVTLLGIILTYTEVVLQHHS
jgi:hypothetical protein